MRSLSLRLLPDAFAIVRLKPNDPIPSWATDGPLFSVTRTPTELSILASERVVPEGIGARRGWRAFEVIGPFPFDEVGVLAALAAPLAHSEISMLAIATYDTDLLLVHGDDVLRASAVLRGVGHVVADAD